jgi:hypothetical protein
MKDAWVRMRLHLNYESTLLDAWMDAKNPGLNGMSPMEMLAWDNEQVLVDWINGELDANRNP